MASVVDICNIGLAHLGSDNQIASISPPDGSVESGYCARFYPIARREMLEMAPWSFSRTRAVLVETTNASVVWTYAYLLPSDIIKPTRVLSTLRFNALLFELRNDATGLAVPGSLFDESGSAKYELEDNVLYTHEPEATLLYRRDVTDSGKFTSLFTTGLGYLMASYLAGPLTRKAGDVLQFRELATALAMKAAASNANSGHEDHYPIASHLAVR